MTGAPGAPCRLSGRWPGELTNATSSNGTVSHLLTERLRSTVSGMQVVHIPYKGDSQALADLLGGHVSMLFSVLLGYPNLVSKIFTLCL